MEGISSIKAITCALQKLKKLMRTEFDDFQVSDFSEEIYQDRRKQFMQFLYFAFAVNMFKVIVGSLTYAPYLSEELFHLLIDSILVVALKLFQRNMVSHFGFVGSFIIWYLEVFLWEDDISISKETPNCLVAAAPALTLLALAKTICNWKWKTLCVVFQRALNIGFLVARGNSVGMAYLMLNLQLCVISIMVFNEGERLIVRSFKMNQQTENEKNKWMNLLHNLPFIVFQYNWREQKVEKQNLFCDSLPQNGDIPASTFSQFISTEQTIRVLDHEGGNFPLLEGFSILGLAERMVEEQRQKVSVKLKQWKKDFIVIQTPIDERQSMLILVDNSLDKQLQVKTISQKMVNLLYQSLSHKFMTPINSLKGVLYVLHSTASNPQALQQIDACMESIFTLEQLIQNLNDLQISQQQELTVQKASCKIHDILEEAFSLFKNQALQKKINLYKEFSNELPERVLTDAKRVKQILFVLLYNAIKYTSKGFVLLQASYSHISEEPQLIITVKDSGCGMEERTLEGVFKIFHNFRKSSHVNCSGIGLGLTILKRVVTALEGSVAISSTLNEGTEVQIQLPIQVSTQRFTSYEDICFTDSTLNLDLKYQSVLRNSVLTSEGQQEEEKIQIRSVTERVRILIVDDDSLNLYALQALLKNQGDYEIEEARNGEEAVEMVMQREKYRLIIMDVNMPVMNGVEATKKLREFSSNFLIDLSATFIYVHSAIQDTLENSSLFNGKLSKPVVLKELQHVLSIIQ